MRETIEFWTSKMPYYEFSNFYMREFVVGDIVYKSNEHYYQSKKTHDPHRRDIILKAHNAMAAAKLGRDELTILRSSWPWMKDAYMGMGLYHKFSQNEDLKDLLLSTGNSLIVERSNKDWYWGTGKDGTGKNMLGIMLMVLRRKLK